MDREDYKHPKETLDFSFWFIVLMLLLLASLGGMLISGLCGVYEYDVFYYSVIVLVISVVFHAINLLIFRYRIKDE